MLSAVGCLVAVQVSVVLTRLEAPPVLNSPVYSLATTTNEGRTNMNILTYATPCGVSPRLWAVSLFRKTQTHKNFMREGAGVLQLLSREHAQLVHSLGGLSGDDIDKASACAKAGFAWLDLEQSHNEQILPGCVAYLRLVQVGEPIDAGEHDLVVCRVESFALADSPPPQYALSSAHLRAAGLITDKGRAVAPI